jgi:Putative zinc-finger
MNAECPDVRQALGVYVVGAIDPAERAFVDQHLATCRDCRDELAGLAGLPALLGRVSLDEVERGLNTSAGRAAPTGRLLDSMLTEVARQQRTTRLRRVMLAAAAAVVLLAGAGAGAGVQALLSGSSSATPPAAVSHWRKVSGRDPTTKVIGEVRFLRRSWGTQTDVAVGGVKYGTRCELWVTDTAGRRVAVGGWQYKDEGSWYPGSTAVATGSIRSFQITANGKTLVTLPVA